MGLIGSPPPAPGQALVIPGTRQVHTFFMNYPIDIALCDAAGMVIHVVRALAPWRLSPSVRGAVFAVETAAGGLDCIEQGEVIEGLDRSCRSR